jgi:tRNA-2-methylthio-N6-dimethylallyladenosine synthase
MTKNNYTYFIQTYGCQMNELDSEVMAGILHTKGLEKANNIDDANIVILNTCSIRKIAENKVLNKISVLKDKGKILGIAGCMPMTNKDELLKKFPFIDFLVGTKNIPELESIIDKLLKDKKNKSFNLEEATYDINYLKAVRKSNLKSSVSIIRGCNNFCSYCVVPYTRGREESRKKEEILDEVKLLANQGVKEITLLGQNVNSYGRDFSKNNNHFPDLLCDLNKIDGIERIRFLTSHPKDITKELIFAIRDLEKLCNHIHFPLQAGSNKILKLMNRSYTVEKYLEMVDFIYKTIPAASLGTDIIIGFPNETEEDFEETYKLFERIRFTQSFIFAYSPRKNTLAYDKFEDNIPNSEKLRRLNKLLNLHKKIVLDDSKKLINKTFDVLIEDYKNDSAFFKGRTTCNRRVIFKAPTNLSEPAQTEPVQTELVQIGTTQKVKIIDINHQTLIGSI